MTTQKNTDASNTDASILILDFGSQYTQLIARRLREMKVYCEIYAYGADEKILTHHHWCGVILSGGPKSVLTENSPRIPEWILTANLPILGICYGMQVLAQQLGGKVEAAAVREFGRTEINIHPKESFFKKIDVQLEVWMSHGDHVVTPPKDFEILASTKDIPIAIMANLKKNWYGLQFHPEVTH